MLDNYYIYFISVIKIMINEYKKPAAVGNYFFNYILLYKNELNIFDFFVLQLLRKNK